MSDETRRRLAVRVATAAWLLGWYWKAWFYLGHLREASAWPIDIDGVPALLAAPWLAAVGYALPLPAAALLGFGGRVAARVGAALLVLAALIGCVHVELFNDATFVTSFWSALWIGWLVLAPVEELASAGPWLARAVVALVFLGGAVGKLDTAYSSGEAFFQLYFVQKTDWPYPWLRGALDADTLRALATWFSRAVMLGEAALAFGPVWPHRVYVRAACVMMLGMVAISTLYLVSVLACLAGVLLASTLLSLPIATSVPAPTHPRVSN